MSENLNQFQDMSEEEDQFDSDLEALDLDD